MSAPAGCTQRSFSWSKRQGQKGNYGEGLGNLCVERERTVVKRTEKVGRGNRMVSDESKEIKKKKRERTGREEGR